MGQDFNGATEQLPQVAAAAGAGEQGKWKRVPETVRLAHTEHAVFETTMKFARLWVNNPPIEAQV